MLLRRSLCKALPVAVFLALPHLAHGQEASAWAEGHRSRVRLIAGGADTAGRLAGVEIKLDSGFKTYWRNPGESGLPPSFDWSKSVNVEAVEVLWPAPTRSTDASGISYGYHGGVVFPVRLRPRQPDRAVTLALRIDYGVCKDICIPARADLVLTLPQQASASLRPLIHKALARVPRPQPLGGDGAMAILAVEPTVSDGKKVLVVHARVPKDDTGNLFVEAPDGWYLAAGPERRPATAGAPDEASFLVEVLEHPKDAHGPVPLRLTLVCDDDAVETTASLDAARLKR
jgi:DsbC/DsbD-like thiol-disulfide interchange protein